MNDITPTVIDCAHYSESFEQNGEGWYEPVCSCGAKPGVFPDAETACDALMQHAYEAGILTERQRRA